MRAAAAWVLAVLLHEAGHLLAAHMLGIPLRRAGGGLFGLRLVFDFSRVPFRREAAVHLAGPGAGILSAVLVRAAAGPGPFSAVSLGLAAVNLLPVRGLDGGGALRCLLEAWLDGDRADRAAEAVSRISLGILWLLGVRSALLSDRMGPLLFAVGLCVGGSRRLSRGAGKQERAPGNR